MESDKLGSAHRTEDVGSALPATVSSFVMTGFNMNSVVGSRKGLSRDVVSWPDMAEDATFALYSCV
jgi:hypothetical protein